MKRLKRRSIENYRRIIKWCLCEGLIIYQGKGDPGDAIEKGI
jgi:hypothetical protein